MTFVETVVALAMAVPAQTMTTNNIFKQQNQQSAGSDKHWFMKQWWFFSNGAGRGDGNWNNT